MLELYHNSMSTCSQKVRLALAEKGQDWTGHHLDLRAGDQHRPDYIRLNPNGVVPTLVHDGAVIIESAVIDEYVDEVFAGTPLRPADAYARARMRLWTKQFDEGLHAASATISVCIAFRTQFLAGKTPDEVEATIAGYVDPVKRERMGENIRKGVGSAYFAPAMGRVVKMMDDMEAALGDGPWLAGEDYSLADIAFAPYVTRVDHLAQKWLFDARPKVAGWLRRMQARPAYQTALADRFIPDFVALLGEKGAAEADAVRKVVENA